MKKILDMALNARTEPWEEFESQSVYMLRQIQAAQSMARLHFLSEVIKADIDDNEPYTQDPEILAILRSAWTKRAGQIKRGET